MKTFSTSAFSTPAGLNDDQLLARLLDLQQRTRMTLTKYQIKAGSFSEMARQARKVISNTEELSELFELFINLQEFAAMAKQRKVLDEAAMTQSGEQSSRGAAATQKRRGTEPEPMDPEKAAPVRAEDASDGGVAQINEETSNAFFDNLDK